MKIFFTFIIALFAITAAASAQSSANSGPQITFDTTSYDFGIITKGSIVTKVYSFKNTGNAPLVITYVEKPCGCMQPSFPKEPILPGQTGEIKVIFTSGEYNGTVRKTMMVKSNSTSKESKEIMLVLRGIVESANNK